MSALARQKVLVLNRKWTPIAIVTMERAMCLVVGTYKSGEPKARIMDPTQDFKLFKWADWRNFIPREGEGSIRGVSKSYRAPEIILLSRFDKLPEQKIHFSRRTIYRRDQNTCQYCDKRPGTAELTIDHIVPKSHGGKTNWDNCVLCCVSCNTRKANRTPEQAKMKLLRKPYRPRFTLYRGDYRCDSWQAILGEAYWSVELQNDM